MKCPECNGFGVAIYWVPTTDVCKENGKYMCKAERTEQICRTCNGSGEVVMTNADRIRAMSDKKLENFIRETVIGLRPWCDWNCGSGTCNTCLANWLQQPAEVE